ncbi:MAG: penicillin-binding protein 2 [Sulfurospirillaceae bacterium]|nr:penicillin-binding protein 2 [Sulfurospirillaceae bacterium]
MRIKILLYFFAFVWLVLLVRIYYISIKSNAYYEEIAKQNAVKTIELPPLRGAILDRNNKPLSVNKLGFSIGVRPQLSSKQNIHILEKEIAFLSEILPLYSVAEMKKQYLRLDSPYGHDFVPVISFVSHESILPVFSKISMRENLKIEISSKRQYPHGDLASHVVGYVGKTDINEAKDDPVAKLVGYSGRTGIEKHYNGVLQGEKGYKKIKVTAFNQEIEEVSKSLPKSSDIVLSIDIELQKYVATLFEGKSGAVVIMDVRNGEILVAGSFPEYDLNRFVSGLSQEEWSALATDLNHPFTNKLINGLYPPGSVIKMGVGLALLSSGIITPYTNFWCTGTLELGGRDFRCWKKDGHGSVNYMRAIKESCDDYFYKASLKGGIDNISPFLEKIGFAKKTNIDLPREFVGSVPGRAWKMQKYRQGWYQGETLITSIGQGYFLVTPLQVARYTALLATGYGVTPHFVSKIDGNDVLYEIDNSIFSENEKKYLKITREAMHDVVNSAGGTANRYVKSKVKIAGKTGTAQVVGISQTEKKRMKEQDMEYYQRSHAWLTTYAPFNNPQYAVTIMIEHGGHGGSEAGPMVSQIYDKLLELGYIEQ